MLMKGFPLHINNCLAVSFHDNKTIDLPPKRIIIHKRKVHMRFNDPERKHCEHE